MTADYFRERFEELLPKMKVKNYEDAYKYSEGVGKAIAEVMEEAKALEFPLDKEGIEALVIPLLNRDFMLMRDASLKAQQGFNKQIKIGLKPLEVHSGGLLNTWIEKIEEASDPYAQTGVAGRNISDSVVNKSMKENANMQARFGVRYYVERINGEEGLHDGKQRCAYCDRWAGIWEAPNIPPEVWGFHDGCTCELYYHKPDGTVEQIH